MSNPMQPKKLSTLEITNFRAFPQPYTFDFQSKNVVIYGENGSGKSSIYRAIEYFFEASADAKSNIEKHKNIFMDDQKNLKENFGPTAEIKLTFDQPLKDKVTVYSWDEERPDHDEIREINTALSLLNYQKLLQLHYVKIDDKTGKVDLWPLLQESILYRTSNRQTGDTFQKDYEYISNLMSTRRRSSQQFEQLKEAIKSYLTAFEDAVDNLSKNANHLLSYFFPENSDDKSNTTIAFEFDEFKIPEESLTGQQIIHPKIFLQVSYYGKPIENFATFLNEARLSAIAISLYLAAIQQIPKTHVQLLVLDDVLLGIDLSNRLKVLKILNEEFTQWQIILLTHDHVWYNMIKSNSPAWHSLELYHDEYLGIPTPVLKPYKDNLQKAKDYLKKKDYPAAGFYARNALEDQIKKWVNDKQLDLTIKAKSGQLFIDLEVYINALIKHYGNQSNGQQIKDQLAIVKNFKNIVLNRLVHNTEITVFANEIKEAISAIDELRNLIQPSKSALPKGAGPVIPPTKNPSQQLPTQTKLKQNINQPSVPKPSTSKNKSRYIPSHHAINQIETWLKMFATIDAGKISIHTDITSLDQETQQIQRLEYGIAFYSYLIPVQIIDKVDESSILHNFTNKTMLTVFTNNVKNDITIKPTSLGILIHDDKLDLLSYPDDSDGSIHSTIVSLDINDPNSNSKKIIYNRLYNILL